MARKIHKIVDLEEELRWHEIDFNEPLVTEHPDGKGFFHVVKYFLPKDYVVDLTGVILNQGQKEIKEVDTYRTGTVSSPNFRTDGTLELMAEGIAEELSVGFNRHDKKFYASAEEPKLIALGIKPVTLAYESFLRGKDNYMHHLKVFWKQ